VGRTARAGRAGKSITLVTQYDVELVQRIEAVIGKQLALWPADRDEVALLRERVDEAGRMAANEMRDAAQSGAGGGGARKRRREESKAEERDRDDDMVEAGMPGVRRKKGKGRR
jgi:ATP-dependent RNA helicase DDX47/RRP3